MATTFRQLRVDYPWQCVVLEEADDLVPGDSFCYAREAGECLVEVLMPVADPADTTRMRLVPKHVSEKDCVLCCPLPDEADVRSYNAWDAVFGPPPEGGQPCQPPILGSGDRDRDAATRAGPSTPSVTHVSASVPPVPAVSADATGTNERAD